MKWTRSSLDHLKVAFGKEPFSAKQAVDALKKQAGYSNNAAYQVLHEHVKEGFSTKLGRVLNRKLMDSADKEIPYFRNLKGKPLHRVFWQVVSRNNLETIQDLVKTHVV